MVENFTIGVQFGPQVQEVGVSRLCKGDYSSAPSHYTLSFRTQASVRSFRLNILMALFKSDLLFDLWNFTGLETPIRHPGKCIGWWRSLLSAPNDYSEGLDQTNNSNVQFAQMIISDCSMQFPRFPQPCCLHWALSILAKHRIIGWLHLFDLPASMLPKITFVSSKFLF